MKQRKYSIVTLVILSFCTLQQIIAQDIENTAKNLINNTYISGQWFLAFQNIEKSGDHENQFTLKRGYLNFKTKLNDKFSIRFTQDITLDKEGNDAGNVEMRLKYLYMKIKTGQLFFLEKSYFEIGLVHRPWLDFEEHINMYRVQGKMFIEKNHLLNSADFGATFVTLFGGEMDADYQSNINSKYPGKYGNLAIGIYNGAGYHAIEKNNNKTIEGRLTLRPFPEHLPGLQFTYNFVNGKGNTQNEPDFKLHQGFTSFESELVNLTAQYITGKGNSSGNFISDSGKADDFKGYSFFGELYIPQTKFSLFSRYDSFKGGNNKNYKARSIIGGVCYHYLKKQKALIDFEYFNDNGCISRIYELAIEIKF